MAVVERISRVTISQATGTREWLATAAVLDTAEGGSVSITITMTSSGVGPVGADTTREIGFWDDAGVQIGSTVALTAGAVSQTISYFFTSDGLSGSSARHGTVEMKLRVQNPNYNVESDGSPNSVPIGATGTGDRGWIRGTTTGVESLSNTGAGSAPNAPAAYDESLFARVTASSQAYAAYTLTTTLTHGSLSGATNSTASVNRDVTFANVVDERFAAAATTVGMSYTVANAALTGSPQTVYTSTTDSTLSVDPRLTCTHHFQTDNDVFTLALDDNTNQMLSTQQGYLWPIVKNARSEGINNLTVSQTLDPVAAGTTIGPISGLTSTQDGQAGVGVRLDWTASKPGGTWDKSVDVTAPSDIDDAAYLLNSTDTYTLLAVDPRVRVVVYLGQSGSSASGRHLEPGDSLKATVTAFSTETRKRLTPDVGTVGLMLIRWNEDLTRFEFVEADGVTWTNWASTTTAAVSATMTDAGDGVTFITTLSSTSGWGLKDIVAVNAVLKINGTPYTEYTPREMVDSFNRHDISRFLSVGEKR